jgi:hypothetical protein
MHAILFCNLRLELPVQQYIQQPITVQVAKFVLVQVKLYAAVGVVGNGNTVPCLHFVFKRIQLVQERPVGNE